MSDTGLAIIATECKMACEGEPNLLKRLEKAMNEVANGHWMFPSDDDLCFRGAVGGVLMAEETTDEEKEQLEFSLKQLRNVGAMLSGVPIDMDRLIEDNEKGPEVLPLVKMWHKAQGK